MTRYLLAADADKIQDFIFRSAHLQEVIGGSHLLSRFCKEGLEKLNDHYSNEKYAGNWKENEDWQVIINDGGRFLLSFKEEEKAEKFGNDLMELYRRSVQGSLTVVIDETGYEHDNKEQFKEANERVQKKLERAKLSSRGALPTEHIPQMAFCASCGVALAVDHKALFETENEMYLCTNCLEKRDERRGFMVGPPHKNSMENPLFINEFRDVIIKNHEGIDIKHLWLPVKPVDAISQYDPRGYVAYLVADGNCMGELFSECDDSEQMTKLSKELKTSIYTALAEPMADIKKYLDERYGEHLLKSKEKGDPDKLEQILPVVPLILGGDDIFVLLPASYAVDFTRRFTKAYETIMKSAKDALQINTGKEPTLSTVVMICKSNYPYKLAHQHGEARLKLVKKMAKSFLPTEQRSVIDVEVILSSERRGTEKQQEERELFVPSLRPFWAHGVSSEHGIPIDKLIQARKDLKDLPNKRREQLRALFYETNLPENKQESIDRWNQKLQHLLERIDRMDANGSNKKNTIDSLKALGDEADNTGPAHWIQVQRETTTYKAHALPDLLRMWDYCYDLKESIEFYE